MWLVKSYSRYKLRNQTIIVNAVIAIIPLCILGFIASRLYFDNAKKDIMSSVNILFTQATGRLDEYFETIDLVCKATFYNANLQETILDNTESSWENNVKINDHLNSNVRFNETIRGISFLNYQGSFFNSSLYTLNREMTNYVKDLKQSQLTNNIYFSGPFMYKGKVMDEYLAVKQINSIITTENFKPILLGVIVLDRNKLQEIINDSLLPENSEVFIIDDNSQIIASTVEEKVHLTLENEYLNLADNGEINNIDGKPFIIRTSIIQKTGWRLAAMISTQELIENVELLQKSIIVLVLILFLFIAIANFAFNFAITKPIKELADAFNSVASGRFNTKLKFSYKNEITTIADNFNTMVDELHNLTRKIFDTQSQLYEVALEKKQIELNGLQEQINSHFLFNTLNCIRGMALTNEKKQIVDMIENLVSYFRYNARKEEYISLTDELKHLNIYLAIQKVRFNGNFKIKFDIEEGLNLINIPKFSLQPLIENAIYHGFSQKYKNAVTKITAFRRDCYYIIKVLDNGIGMEASRLKEITVAIETGELQPKSDTDKKSIAIVNVHKRLQLYYGKQYGLVIKSWRNIGTAVILKIPFNEGGI